MNRKNDRSIVPAQKGLFTDIAMRIKLILRLMGDSRVSFWLKLLPIGALAYLISPIDVMPDIALPVVGVLDDAAILWLGYYLFLEMAPAAVVREHLNSLTSNAGIVDGADDTEGDVVDGEITDEPK